MSIAKEMISVKETVIRVLEQRPDSRDSDKLLIALIWFTECRSKGILEDTTTNFLTKLSKGEFTSAESIRRQRQELQKEYPNLRGVNYKGRKAEEEQVKKLINKTYIENGKEN